MDEKLIETNTTLFEKYIGFILSLSHKEQMVFIQFYVPKKMRTKIIEVILKRKKDGI